MSLQNPTKQKYPPTNESQSKPGIKMVYPEPCFKNQEGIKKKTQPFLAENCPLLTFNPRIGFEHAAQVACPPHPTASLDLSRLADRRGSRLAALNPTNHPWSFGAKASYGYELQLGTVCWTSFRWGFVSTNHFSGGLPIKTQSHINQPIWKTGLSGFPGEAPPCFVKGRQHSLTKRGLRGLQKGVETAARKSVRTPVVSCQRHGHSLKTIKGLLVSTLRSVYLVWGVGPLCLRINVPFKRASQKGLPDREGERGLESLNSQCCFLFSSDTAHVSWEFGPFSEFGSQSLDTQQPMTLPEERFGSSCFQGTRFHVTSAKRPLLGRRRVGWFPNGRTLLVSLRFPRYPPRNLRSVAVWHMLQRAGQIPRPFSDGACESKLSLSRLHRLLP